MTLTKLVDGKRVTLTAKERTEREKEEALYEANKPIREWEASIQQTDQSMPRALEDVIDVLSETARSKLATQTLDAYNEKKTIRSEKPE